MREAEGLSPPGGTSTPCSTTPCQQHRAASGTKPQQLSTGTSTAPQLLLLLPGGGEAGVKQQAKLLGSAHGILPLQRARVLQQS